jgi:DNA polymerase III epsilon subunit-like protein
METKDKRIFTGIGLDFETGGLDCTKSACTQIALQAIRLDTYETIDRYVRYIAPYYKQDVPGQSKRKVLRPKRELQLNFHGDPMEYDPRALSYSGITMDKLAGQGIDIREAAGDIIRFASRNTLSPNANAKPVLIGQNIAFDIGFLQQAMNYAGLVGEFEKAFAGTRDFYGNFQPHYIDTIDLARLALADDPSVSSYKLELIAGHFGIELDDAHDADADITATLDIVRVCSSRMRNREEGDEAVIRKKEKTRMHFKI